MRKNISPKYFNAFLAVVETGSFSSAANRAYMTQANISKHIQALEEELGHALFIRTSKTPVITEAGKSLLEYIKKIDDLNDELLLGIAGSQQSMKGVVRYAMLHPRMLNSNLSKLKEEWHLFQNMEMNVFIDHQDNIIHKVLDGSVDFGFVTHQSDNARLKFKLFSQEEYVLVGAEPELIESIKSGADLLAQKYIEYPGMNAYFDSWKTFNFPDANFVNSSFLYYGGRTNNIDSAILMLRGGAGISILPRNYAHQYIESGRLTEWSKNKRPFMSDIFIVTLADQVMSKRVNMVMDFFINAVDSPVDFSYEL